jgi:hypothetical protein
VSQGQRHVVFSLGDVDVILNVGGGSQGGSGAGDVTVSKRGAHFCKHDLALLARAMQLANDLTLCTALVRFHHAPPVVCPCKNLAASADACKSINLSTVHSLHPRRLGCSIPRMLI